MIRTAPPGDVAGVLELLRRSANDLDCDVHGTSMGAAIPPGSRACIALDGGAPARPGDVVAILLGGEILTLHRLVARGKSFVLTRGDGNRYCDAPQPLGRVLGTVRGLRTPSGDLAEVPGTAARASAFDAAMRAAFMVHPRLAIGLKNLLVIALTPLLRWRYGPGAGRSTSRLEPMGRVPLP